MAWSDPVWRKAPGVLLRSPGVLLGLFITAGILGLAAASGPLFLASGANAAFDAEVERVPARHAGLTVMSSVWMDATSFRPADVALRDAAGEVAALAPPETSLLGVIFGVGEADVRMRPYAATGAVDALEPVAAADSEGGVWVPQSVTAPLGITAGDEVELRYGSARTTVTVAGVYRTITQATITPYWAEISGLILPRDSGATIEPPPPPLMVMDEATLLSIGEAVGLAGTATWRFPLQTEGLVLDDARAAASALTALERDLRSTSTPRGAAFRESMEYAGQLRFSTPLGDMIRGTDATLAGMLGPVRTLSVAAQLVAVVVVGAAAAFRARRRRIELQLLATQGVGPAGQAGRALVETLPVVLAGGAAGWVAAWQIVSRMGPARVGLFDATGADAVRDVVWAAAVGLITVAIVTAAITRTFDRPLGRLGRTVRRLPWEPVAVALAAAAYYQLRLGGSPVVQGGDGPRVDALILLFPLLLLAGFSGIAVRLLSRVLPNLRRVGAGWPVAPYLALRRLTGASATAMLLIVAAAMGLGVLVYAGALVASNGDSALAKARTAVGSDVAAHLQRGGHADLDIPGSTVVGRGTATLQPGDVLVDLLAVDGDSFPGAVHWDDGFADASLGSLLDRLPREGEEPLPLLVVGTEGPLGEGLLQSPRFRMPVETAARADLFPGASAERPLVMVDRASFAAAFSEVGGVGDPERVLDPQLWSTSAVDRVADELAARSILVTGITTAAAFADQPDVRAVTWTLGYLRAVGVLAAVLALASALLYLQERQQAREVSYALASRMGLSARAHRRAIGLELFGMLGIALALGGALALLAARLIIPEIDPLPAIPPGPALVFPAATSLAAIFAVGVACVGGAALTQRAADRARMGEVLRVAG